MKSKIKHFIIELEEIMDIHSLNSEQYKIAMNCREELKRLIEIYD